uniref:Uncharacterized protein n=1 Tax=Chromera velia CCMP2878 TaxID=1169474 RepID=A0A0G4GHN5_9ALVE|mmetsp:Transcript_2816/g.5831  ORF Transcript_2816/g.5831 Transcript_2816/m.5831 type:complete len:127 (+) Transcript_2816:165-545(+)|eukprot:Cvel_21925.t1-p1 / transcript=Cvel_21925.t1 / gene=Cvel_21925 / organism=Chromera_velia_CCMP2878 / gene_product=hypothetical protein / transcript_product=hypothetical protein / location=Cvel_scaffold2102:21755-22980(+) / protein_length=126 / sequence_SO=supercontig / SO=protein_coding / is_pseudo=false
MKFFVLALLCLAVAQAANLLSAKKEKKAEITPTRGGSIGTVSGDAESVDTCTVTELTDCKVTSKCEASESFVHNLGGLDNPTSFLSNTCWCATGSQTGCILELAHSCTGSAVGCRCGDSSGVLENF